MARSRDGSKARRWLAGFTVVVLVAGATLIPATSVAAASPDTTVIAWNRHAVDALSNPLPTSDPTNPANPGAALPPPVAAIHLAIVQGAVYDAINAIDRTHEPYLSGLPRPSRLASKAAAAATAAHHVLVGLRRGTSTDKVLPAVVITRIDNLWNARLARIRSGTAKRDGIRIGAAVAAAWLRARSDDLRFGTFRFTPAPASSTVPGQWKVTPPANGNDPNGWVARVRPFTLRRTSQFRTAGPLPLLSLAYQTEFNEVKAMGAREGSSRTAAQTDLARFYSGNPLPMMNQALRQIASARQLSLNAQARLFVMTSVSGADSLINCWDDKAHWSWWRPITAIRAADDGNPVTVQDSTWTPLLDGPPYPDHPSGYNCYSAGMMYMAKRFFATDTITFKFTSSLTGTVRTYRRFTAVLTDTINARVWNGFHFRTPDVQGAALGQKVAAWVASRFFRPVNN